MKPAFLLFILLSFYCVIASGQKSVHALRINEEIIIDGILDEEAWSESDTATDFITHRPMFGNVPEQNTIVRVLYDDEALYISAEMEEISRDSIMTQLTQRDNLGNTDFFAILLDTYGNGTDGLVFVVGATGVQFDAKKANDGGNDIDWDAIWFSEVNLHDTGWNCEIKLPYSAIRFPKKEEQKWIINFTRQQTRKKEESTWVGINPSIDGIFNQSGILDNIKNIKPPVRLSFSPYLSAYTQHHFDSELDPPHSVGYSYNGGMDVKYGLNDAFTLDMTLIPDFGQVQSDDQVLNLSPFEVRFSENRPFFTEGLEMFSKAGIFYTRRVGGPPVGLGNIGSNLQANEIIDGFDQAPQLYNATKISGRNRKGLGIGVFNAIEAATYAHLTDTLTGKSREIQTSPLSNYSVIVLDQNLKNNSFISLINTNVWRKGQEYYDANVIGTEFEFKDKEQLYGISGVGAYSIQSFNNTNNNNTGYKFALSAGKISGNLNYWIEYVEESPDYNPNDLGFARRANEREVELGTSYEIFNPFLSFNRANFWLETEYSRVIEPDAFQRLDIDGGLSFETKTFWNFNIWFGWRPASYDYFEPRVPGRYVEIPSFWNTGLWLGTDDRKKFRMEYSSFIYQMKEEGRWGYNIATGPRYRVSDKFTFGMSNRYNVQFKDTGFISKTDDNSEITFGKRKRQTIENIAKATYNFSEKIGLIFRMRHYWNKGTYNSYHILNDDGTLHLTDFQEDRDFSFSQFNIDLNFNWRFAPGSDIFINWKNSIADSRVSSSNQIDQLNYFDILKDLGSHPQDNSLSVRIVYYLDYLQLKKQT